MLKINREQWSLMQQEVAYAYDKVPFYKQLLDKAEVTPDELVTLQDVVRLPFTGKKLYRKHFPIGVFAQDYQLNDENLIRSQSSGTTGERLITYEVGVLLSFRAMECSAAHPDVEDCFTKSKRRICRYAAPNCSDVECANPNSGMEDRLLSDGTLVLPVYHDLLTTSDALIARAIDEILTYQPDLYYVDPTHFAFLLRHFNKRGVKPYKAPIVTSYTYTSQLARKQIEQAFDYEVSPSQLYSSSEMGWIAMECQEGNLHLNTNSFFIELVRNNRHAEFDEVGELVISSIDNGAIPHLRYRTGDAMRVKAESCSCGLDTPVAVMEGRLTHFIKKDGRYFMSPAELDRLVGTPDWLQMYKFTQQDEDRFHLQLITSDTYKKGDEMDLLAQLRTALQTEQLAMQIDNYIPADRSGKFQCVSSNVELMEERF